ncbi:hypothetical protein DIPPA_55784 [Diplonema papillatum]|nr:hypothetical protein DIPPA_55784 [Diplonema papillatum]
MKLGKKRKHGGAERTEAPAKRVRLRHPCVRQFGSCFFGDDCKWIDKDAAVCAAWLGRHGCRRGIGCVFVHSTDPEELHAFWKRAVLPFPSPTPDRLVAAAGDAVNQSQDQMLDSKASRPGHSAHEKLSFPAAVLLLAYEPDGLQDISSASFFFTLNGASHTSPLLTNIDSSAETEGTKAAIYRARIDLLRTNLLSRPTWFSVSDGVPTAKQRDSWAPVSWTAYHLANSICNGTFDCSWFAELVRGMHDLVANYQAFAMEAHQRKSEVPSQLPQPVSPESVKTFCFDMLRGVVPKCFWEDREGGRNNVEATVCAAVSRLLQAADGETFSVAAEARTMDRTGAWLPDTSITSDTDEGKQRISPPAIAMHWLHFVVAHVVVPTLRNAFPAATSVRTEHPLPPCRRLHYKKSDWEALFARSTQVYPGTLPSFLSTPFGIHLPRCLCRVVHPIDRIVAMRKTPDSPETRAKRVSLREKALGSIGRVLETLDPCFEHLRAPLSLASTYLTRPDHQRSSDYTFVRSFLLAAAIGRGAPGLTAAKYHELALFGSTLVATRASSSSNVPQPPAGATLLCFADKNCPVHECTPPAFVAEVRPADMSDTMDGRQMTCVLQYREACTVLCRVYLPPESPSVFALLKDLIEHIVKQLWKHRAANLEEAAGTFGVQLEEAEPPLSSPGGGFSHFCVQVGAPRAEQGIAPRSTQRDFTTTADNSDAKFQVSITPTVTQRARHIASQLENPRWKSDLQEVLKAAKPRIYVPNSQQLSITAVKNVTVAGSSLSIEDARTVISSANDLGSRRECVDKLLSELAVHVRTLPANFPLTPFVTALYIRESLSNWVSADCWLVCQSEGLEMLILTCDPVVTQTVRCNLRNASFLNGHLHVQTTQRSTSKSRELHGTLCNRRHECARYNGLVIANSLSVTPDPVFMLDRMLIKDDGGVVTMLEIISAACDSLHDVVLTPLLNTGPQCHQTTFITFFTSWKAFVLSLNRGAPLESHRLCALIFGFKARLLFHTMPILARFMESGCTQRLQRLAHISASYSVPSEYSVAHYKIAFDASYLPPEEAQMCRQCTRLSHIKMWKSLTGRSTQATAKKPNKRN